MKNAPLAATLAPAKIPMKDHCLHSVAWIRVKGELPIIPKDEGFGIMVSAFQSREFGFGFKLTSDDQKVVNEYHSVH